MPGAALCGCLQLAPLTSPFPLPFPVQVPFVVWSTAQPALNATATRTLVIAPPCDPGLFACPSSTGKLLCSGVPCTLLATLLPAQRGPLVAFVAAGAAPPPPGASGSPAPPPPSIGLPPPPPPPPQLRLQRQQVVLMSYGTQPPQSLLPCSTAAEAAGGGCRAVAYDAAVSLPWRGGICGRPLAAS